MVEPDRSLKAQYILGAAAEGDSVNLETWCCLQPKLLVISPGNTNSVLSVGPPQLLKVFPLLRGTTGCTSVTHSGLGAHQWRMVVVVAVEARLVLKSRGLPGLC